MKLMPVRQWVEMGGILLSAMATVYRSGMVAAEIPRRLIRLEKQPNSREIRHQSFAGKPFYAMGLQLLDGLGLSNLPVIAHERAETPKNDNALSWNLTGTTVVNLGQVDVLAEGEFAHDFIIEAKAFATDPAGSVVPAGTFKLVLSAFSPAHDQCGQKKGSWYVWGKWTLTDINAPQSRNGNQRAGEISGQISAELKFNPIVTQKKWTAEAWPPMTRIAPVAQAGSNRLTRGKGALSMDSKREGSMSLNLNL